MPKQFRGCHNCSQRRIVCDQTHPQCTKCLRKGLECSGYGVRYRFNKGIASRGKFTGRELLTEAKNVPSTQIKQSNPTNLLWPDGTVTPGTTWDLPGPKLPNMETELIPLERNVSLRHVHDNYTTDCEPLNTTGTHERHAQATSRELGHITGQSNQYPSFTSTSVPPSLELISLQHQSMFECFSKEIAPVMVVLDGNFNGYRDLILPLAWQDDLVRAAVSVVSMYYLSAHEPELRAKADAGFQFIIRRLLMRTSQHNTLLDVSAWTTIIILLTGETVTGSNSFPYLFKLLQHLSEAHMNSDRESVMHAFLAEQTRMMTLFAQPLLGENTGVMTLRARPERYFDFITNAAIFHPALRPQIDIYKAAIHRACNIYLNRATRGALHAENAIDLKALQMLCDQVDPDTPGHHTLVWVYFVAAAESTSLEDRDFFTRRLQEVFSRTRFHNIPIALAALQELWRVQNERKWTEVLPEIMPVFII